jgi:hypothetical protein
MGMRRGAHSLCHLEKLIVDSFGRENLIHGSSRFVDSTDQFGAHINQFGIQIQTVLEAFEAGILHHRGRLQHPKEKRDKPLSRFQVVVLPVSSVVRRCV